ncbi:hypothetical protein Fmac_018335 [Flemingia macrophylla]|uniref:Uncharacterized protein n=1 Tax=Flemingia macrophylla TaxID=520843 RepID=A0ABD1M4P2_9FABA
MVLYDHTTPQPMQVPLLFSTLKLTLVNPNQKQPWQDTHTLSTTPSAMIVNTSPLGAVNST